MTPTEQADIFFGGF